MSFSFVISLTDQELITLYAWLKRDEMNLGKDMRGVLSKLEKILYEKLTIEEIEEIFELAQRLQQSRIPGLVTVTHRFDLLSMDGWMRP